jgi:hypothetical protein
MDPKAFTEFRDQHYRAIANINDKKGHDYAGEEDALANFKEQARDIDVSVFQVWFTYFHKHWSAVKTFVKEGDVQSEPIEGRVHDCILYLFLLLGLIHDAEHPGAPDVGPYPIVRCQAEQDGFRCELYDGHEDEVRHHYANLGRGSQVQWLAAS